VSHPGLLRGQHALILSQHRQHGALTSRAAREGAWWARSTLPVLRAACSPPQSPPPLPAHLRLRGDRCGGGCWRCNCRGAQLSSCQGPQERLHVGGHALASHLGCERSDALHAGRCYARGEPRSHALNEGGRLVTQGGAQCGVRRVRRLCCSQQRLCDVPVHGGHHHLPCHQGRGREGGEILV